MTIKIATWNVNSLRVRLPHVLLWLSQVQPDVLALQEIKLLDADFPYAEIAAAGYQAVVSGQKAYNGVAILSRVAPTDVVTDIPSWADPQRRILAATVLGIRVINLYVPNGESLASEKYVYKLRWLTEMHTYLASELALRSPMVVLGDFNIAPTDLDVHDPVLWQDSVLCDALGRQKLADICHLGLQDCFRLLNPTEKSFSWWDYRMNAFKRKMGLRIDHILADTALATHCTRCYIDATPRGWERPSDHAPVVGEFVV